jgi:rare lipoprotein A
MRPCTLPIAAAILATTLATAAHAQSVAPTVGGAAFGDTGGLTVEPGSLLGDDLTISGSLASAANATVRVERRDPATGAWTPIGRDGAGPDGAFSITWETDAIGPNELRAVPDSTPSVTTATTANSAPDLPSALTTVFRPATATWYGPGFWGQKTACGVKLTRTTLGVAHKTLPCGTRVTLYRDGRQLDVPVIDRGPFAHGASLDLTQATAEAIGMTQTEKIGYLRTPVPEAPAKR